MAAGVRASDLERERAADRLRHNAATGRLTVEELTARLEAAFAARTRDQLDAQFHDLPPEPDRERRQGNRRPASGHTRAYVLVCLGLIAIWALTGMGYFWPVWPILGWGIGVVSHRRSSRGRCTARSRRIGAARPRPSSPWSR